MATDAFALKGKVIEVLGGIQDKKSGKNLLDALMVERVEVKDGEASVTLVFPDDTPKDARWAVEDAVATAIEKLEGVTDVNVLGQTRSHIESGGASRPAAPPPPAASAAAGGHAHAPKGGAAASGQAQSKPLEGVGKVIAVASGKGGVGKSTVAVNLALALKKLGHNVGLLDVDIYGPSLPTMLGVTGRPSVKEKKIIPLEAEGLKLMSLGFLMDEDTPVIWRGPIVSGIIRQFLQDVDWKGTDYLILDLPPGTGDAQLSLAQSVPLDAAIVVTTPSDLALVDAARGLQMFKTLKVEVMGIVENMSHYLWPGAAAVRGAVDQLRRKGADPAALATIEQALHDNGRLYIFGEGGGKREAKRLGTAFLGEIPLDGGVRKGGDSGKPIVVGDPSSPVTEAFMELARRVAREQPIAKAEGEAETKKRRGLFSFLRG
jgi:ATP-binding protein involved in chromosome partitioning